VGVTRKGIGMKGHIMGRFITFKVGRFFKGERATRIFQPLGEGGQFTLNLCQFSCNSSLEGVQVGIVGSNFKGHSLDVYPVLFGFILQVKELFIVNSGHGWRGSGTTEKRVKTDVYECV
jgi:hypothetical protein